MAERSVVQIIMKARGGREVATETGLATRGVDRLGRSTRLLTGGLATMGRAAGIAGAALGYGLYRGAKVSIAAATDVNESLTKNEVLFGEHAKTIEKFSDTSARSLGIGRRAALEYTGTFGNLFEALEIGDKRSAGLSVGLTKLAADMASFNNATPEEALEALRSGLVGETEPLRRFGVNINDAALREEAFSQGLIKSKKNVLEPRVKALAAVALATKQTEAAHGDFARTSGGLANQQRILNASLDDVAVTFGDALLPTVTKGVRFINREAVPILQDFARQFDNIFDRDDLDLGEKLVRSGRKLRRAADPLVEDLVEGIKNANLDDRLEDAIVWAAPKIADGMAAAAPRAAKAFVNAWLESGVWGRLLTAALLTKYLGLMPGGLFTQAGRKGGTRFGKGFLLGFGALGIGSIISDIISEETKEDIAQPLADAITGVDGREQARQNRRAFAENQRRARRTITRNQNAPTLNIFTGEESGGGRGASRRSRPPIASREQPIHIQVPVNIDGKKVAEVDARHRVLARERNR